MQSHFGLLCIFVTLYHGVEMARLKLKQGWLEGEQLVPVTGDGLYYSFKGIPYAAPPVGSLRFKAPQGPVSWSGLLNATQHGAVCTQFDTDTQKIVPGSEDCLFLNVYSPNLNRDDPLPVMFYIHGGGFMGDSGNVDHYGPDFLTQHGVVLVTINYRLDSLGYLSLDTADVPGNAAMRDQIAAMKWVKTNIKHFGGDPDNVTIFGQSAGAACITYHLLSPLSKGLFKRAIAMSGVPFCDWALPYEPRRRAFVLGKQLGKNTNDVIELLEFLQSVPADKLVGTRPCVLTSENITDNKSKMYHFTPVVEKKFGQDFFIAEQPIEVLDKSNFNDVDLLMGHTSEEGVGQLLAYIDLFLSTYPIYAEMFVPRKILMKSTPNEILGISDIVIEHYYGNKVVSNETIRESLTFLNEATFFYDIYRYISRYATKSKHRTYFYKFSCVSNRNIYGGSAGAKYGLSGASHQDDTAYLFDPKIANLPLVKNSREYKMIQQTCTLFTNFAKFGNPTPDNSLGVVWPEYNIGTKSYMNIDEQLSTGNALDAEAVAFWKPILQKAGIEF